MHHTVYVSTYISMQIQIVKNTKKTTTAAVTAEYTQLLSTIVNEHKFRAAKKLKNSAIQKCNYCHKYQPHMVHSNTNNRARKLRFSIFCQDSCKNYFRFRLFVFSDTDLVVNTSNLKKCFLTLFEKFGVKFKNVKKIVTRSLTSIFWHFVALSHCAKIQLLLMNNILPRGMHVFVLSFLPNFYPVTCGHIWVPISPEVKIGGWNLQGSWST